MFGGIIYLGLCSEYRSSFTDTGHIKKAVQNCNCDIFVGDDMLATNDINNMIISFFASPIFINSLKFLWVSQQPTGDHLHFSSARPQHKG